MKLIRFIRGITQFQLRVLTGINTTKISFIENGLIEPRREEKLRLAKALGVSLDDLWKEDPTEREIAQILSKCGVFRNSYIIDERKQTKEKK